MEAGLLASVGSSIDRFAAIDVDHSEWGTWGEVYRFMRGHLEQYGNLPTHDVLIARFPDWRPPQGEYDYWLNELRRLVLMRKVQLRLRDSIPELEQDPVGATQRLVADLMTLQASRDSGVLATDASAAERLDKYLLRKDLYLRTGGRYIHGIPTGLAPIDNSGQGWMPGELVGILARPGVGKSWMLLYLGVLAWANKSQYRVLCISPEMPARQLALRIDVLMAHQLGVGLSHRALYRGDPTQEQGYRQLTGLLQQHERWTTVDSVEGREVTVSDIVNLYRQLKPDMILIDGVSLLRDEEGGESTWHEMKNLCYGLKRFATATNCIVMISHQVKRGDKALGRSDEWIMPSLSDAAYGDAFVQACSTILTMCVERDDNKIRWYAVRKSREREIEDPRREPLLWDVDTGRIEDAAGQEVQDVRARLLQLGGAAGNSRTA